MHEASLALAVLEIAEQEAARCRARRITRIRLAVGPFVGLEWETFAAFFALAAARGPAQGATLERESAPANARCRNCSQDFALHNLRDSCPACHHDEFDCFDGRTLAVVALEAEPPADADASGGQGAALAPQGA